MIASIILYTNVMKWKEFLHKYERHLSSGALVIGFIIDNLTFQRIDRLLDSLILLAYILLSALSVYLLSVGKLPRILPIVLQFLFGGLASALFIFYSRSGSLASSWPFLFALAGLLIGNELFKSRYEVFSFRISVFFFVLFSFVISYLPVVLGKIGPFVFVLSGVISLVLIWLFLRLIPDRPPYVPILGIFLAVNFMYFANIIPPIPLALKDFGIFHSLVRNSSGQYEVLAEQEPWYAFLQTKKVHIAPGETLYAYSAVFAPTRLSLNIVHQWQYKSDVGWQTVSALEFPIVGGRDGGYRGYSFHRNVTPGEWRVNIKTSDNQIIGRIDFVAINGPPLLERQLR